MLKKTHQAKTWRVQNKKIFKKGFINNVTKRNRSTKQTDSQFKVMVDISEMALPDLIDVSDLEDDVFLTAFPENLGRANFFFDPKVGGCSVTNDSQNG